MPKTDINRLDLNILMVLAKDSAIDELSGMTINEINSYYGEDQPLLSARPNLSKRIRGLCNMGYIEKGSVIERLTTKNIFAPMQNDRRCEYVGIINIANRAIKKEEIIKLVGTPRRTFEGFGSDKLITVISGMSYPFDHINSIKDIAKQKHDERQNAIRTAPIATLEDIDFEEETVSKPVETEKKATKKPSRRELLKMLQN